MRHLVFEPIRSDIADDKYPSYNHIQYNRYNADKNDDKPNAGFRVQSVGNKITENNVAHNSGII